jgi:DNA-binding NtrC family response regulator
LKEGTGYDLIRCLKHCGTTIPVIVITGFPDIENIRTAEELEVHSYLTKPFTIEQIQYSVRKGLEKRRIELEKRKFDKQLDTQDNLGLIGISSYMCELRKQILKIASADFPVIIYGASGTGKDVIANTIHQYSKRNKNPIIPVNCAAIPEHLEEAEFFGYAEGAFTGASHARQGIIATADKSASNPGKWRVLAYW